MTDILTLVFRAFSPQTGQKKDPRAGAPSPAPLSSSSTALLVGEHRLSRSVLLLAAVTAASELGVRVAFFAQSQIQSLPVCLQRGSASLSPEGLKKITFSYPRTLEQLLHQVASLHESPSPPSLIIVDRLDGFLREPVAGSHAGFHSGPESSAAHLSALLCDTAAFLSRALEQRGSSSAPCRVIASFLSDVDSGQEGRDPSATDPILDVLDRYFQARCTLDQDRSYEAVAAAAQEVWHIYVSGTKDCEEGPALAQEWKLFSFPDGLMEFILV
ncbi:ATPase SWSAP1 [Fundulus heteroclitus]|uniref:ATPase SWSAP1 n=1 Tax=Fundulus heteroclitus TaxID=8078 RepID=UPI00165C9DF8|nr:ATPase SWSAP1 [Fundulus heteroclitus]